ncbi:hypothetical protein EDB85DRAFT_504846 [Lactarius pseudohatsudake]|nr:hypothetical protein EDB85DRAFT_504846 [Lactarius pseudohatsudake]
MWKHSPSYSPCRYISLGQQSHGGGRHHKMINPRTLDVITAIGTYQEGNATNVVNCEPASRIYYTNHIPFRCAANHDDDLLFSVRFVKQSPSRSRTILRALRYCHLQIIFYPGKRISNSHCWSLTLTLISNQTFAPFSTLAQCLVLARSTGVRHQPQHSTYGESQTSDQQILSKPSPVGAILHSGTGGYDISKREGLIAWRAH